MFYEYIANLSADHIFAVCVTIGTICSVATSFSALAIAKRSSKQEAPATEMKAQAEASWFEVKSVEDLGRKIHAGVTILQAESKSDFWTERQKANFSTAASYVQAAEDLVLRHK